MNLTSTRPVAGHALNVYVPVHRGADAFHSINEEQEALRQKAFADALDSRALKPETARLEALEEFARAKIRSHNAEPYDPVKNLDDAAREEQFEKDKNDANEQEQALQHSHAKVRECAELVAKLQFGVEPVVSTTLRLVIIVATLLLAGTLIPTICDALSQ